MDNRVVSLLRQAKILVTDVDGVLTDGKISYTSDGQEIKSFHIQDGLGLKLLDRAGFEIAIITGRTSPMVERRAAELGIKHLVQGREDKCEALLALANSLGYSLEQCIYVGDDLPDLAAVRASGVGCSVADAHPAVQESADIVSQRAGGEGAMREICELILQARGQLDDILDEYLGQ